MKRFSIYLLCCLFAVMQSMANVPPPEMGSPTTVPLAGHRGSVWGVENTMEAFLSGIQAGYKYLEIDVQVTKDNVFICCHNENLGGYGLNAASTVIAEKNWAELKNLTLSHKRYGRTYTDKLCTVEDVVDTCKKYDVIPMFDIKVSETMTAAERSKVDGLVAMIKNKGIESKACFISDNEPSFAYIRTKSTQVLIHRNGTYTTKLSEAVSAAEKYDLILGFNVDKNTTPLSKTIVDDLHKKGFKVCAYVLKNYADLPTYEAMGVDMITFEPNLTITLDPVTPTVETVVGTKTKQVVTLTGLNITEDIAIWKMTQKNPVFTISPTTWPKDGGKVTITYKPTKVGNDTAYVWFEGSKGIIKRTIIGTATAEPFPFKEVWNYSETSGKTTDWAHDFSQLRNLDFGEGKLYVVAEGKRILIVNAITGELISELNTTGVSGGAVDLVDCQYMSGKIVACNIATASSPLKVYVWDDDRSAPRVLLQTNDLGGFSRLGDCLTIRGNLTNGELLFAGNDKDGYTSLVYYTITNGVCETTPTVKPMQDAKGKLKFGTSPRVIPSSTTAWWCTGGARGVTYFPVDGITTAALCEESLEYSIAGNAFKSFKFDNVRYALATAYDVDADERDKRKNGHVVLLKQGDGASWETSKPIGSYPMHGLGSTPNTSYSTSFEATANGTKGMELWMLVHNQGIAYYKYGEGKAWNPTLTGTPSVSTEMKQTDTNMLTYHLQDGVLSIEGVEAAQIILYTLSGQRVCEIQKSNTLPVALPKGMYIAKVTEKGGVTYTEKVLVK